MSFFFFKQKTAYELRISDWSSDVCSSDLGHRRLRRTPAQPRGRRARAWHRLPAGAQAARAQRRRARRVAAGGSDPAFAQFLGHRPARIQLDPAPRPVDLARDVHLRRADLAVHQAVRRARSEEHTSELQSLMRILYAVFCLKNTTQL